MHSWVNHLHNSRENNFSYKGETEIPHTHISMLNHQSAVCWNVGHPLLFSKQRQGRCMRGNEGVTHTYCSLHNASAYLSRPVLTGEASRTHRVNLIQQNTLYKLQLYYGYNSLSLVINSRTFPN